MPAAVPIMAAAAVAGTAYSIYAGERAAGAQKKAANNAMRQQETAQAESQRQQKRAEARLPGLAALAGSGSRLSGGSSGTSLSGPGGVASIPLGGVGRSLLGG
jgi:hypothetical protein